MSKTTDIIHSPWYDGDLNDWLLKRGYTFFSLRRDSFAYEKYGLYPSTLDFEYINALTAIRIGFVNDMVYVFGWREDEDRSDWVLCWQFTNPGNEKGFQAILKSYLNSL